MPLNPGPPHVTVVIPTYNRSWGLKRAIVSVLAQTFADFELIVSDDASTDDTPEVARSFTDSRIVYQRNANNLGIPGNWGAGLWLARGEYVCFLMDDDYYDPDFLTNRVVVMSSSADLVSVFSSYRRRPENGDSGELFRPQWLSSGLVSQPEFMKAVLNNYMFIGATMYRAALVRAVWPQAEQYSCIADHALNLHLARRPGATAFFLDKPDFNMASHAEQISVTRAEQVYELGSDLLEEFMGLVSTPTERAWIRRRLSDWHLLCGRKAREQQAYKLASQRLRRAIHVRPTNWGAWRQYARLVTGW